MERSLRLLQQAAPFRHLVLQRLTPSQALVAFALVPRRHLVQPATQLDRLGTPPLRRRVRLRQPLLHLHLLGHNGRRALVSLRELTARVFGLAPMFLEDAVERTHVRRKRVGARATALHLVLCGGVRRARLRQQLPTQLQLGGEGRRAPSELTTRRDRPARERGRRLPRAPPLAQPACGRTRELAGGRFDGPPPQCSRAASQQGALVMRDRRATRPGRGSPCVQLFSPQSEARAGPRPLSADERSPLLPAPHAKGRMAGQGGCGKASDGRGGAWQWW